MTLLGCRAVEPSGGNASSALPAALLNSAPASLGEVRTVAVADAHWPSCQRAQPCALKAVACSYYSAMETLSSQLLQLFALALGLEPQCVPHTAGGSDCSARVRTHRMHTPAARTPAATAAARVRTLGRMWCACT